MIKYTLRQSIFTVFAGMLISSLAIGQDIRLEQRTTKKVPTGTDAPVDSDATFMTSDFMGIIVKDNADNNLGEVKDLVVNARGEVLYLAVQPDQSQANEAEGLVFLPFSALNLDGRQDQKMSYITTVITRDRFVEAPVFTRQRFYASGGPAPVFAQVNRFFGVRGPRVGFGFDGRGRRDGFRGDRDDRGRDSRDGRGRDTRDQRDGRDKNQDPMDADNPVNRNSDSDERTGRRMRRDQRSDTTNGPKGSSKVKADAKAKPDAKVETDAATIKPMTQSGSTETNTEVQADVNTEGKVETPTQPKSPQVDEPATEQPSSPAPEATPEI